MVQSPLQPRPVLQLVSCGQTTIFRGPYRLQYKHPVVLILITPVLKRGLATQDYAAVSIGLPGSRSQGSYFPSLGALNIFIFVSSRVLSPHHT